MIMIAGRLEMWLGSDPYWYKFVASREVYRMGKVSYKLAFGSYMKR